MAKPGVEIERKFLVADRPRELKRSDATQIRQGYLAIGEDGSEVRVRERDGKMTLTVKRGGGRTRAEEEIELDAGEFERLWPLTDGRRLVKRRHEVPYAGLTVEVTSTRARSTGSRSRRSSSRASKPRMSSTRPRGSVVS